MMISTPSGPVSLQSMARDIGVDSFGVISAAAVTAHDGWHGRLVRFSGACTVTIPAGLRSDFSCGWSQDGSSKITFAEGAGVTLESENSLLQSGNQYALGSLVMMDPDVVRLSGSLS